MTSAEKKGAQRGISSQRFPGTNAALLQATRHALFAQSYLIGKSLLEACRYEEQKKVAVAEDCDDDRM